MNGLFIFHRDLRLTDNTSLSMMKDYKVLPVFIFDPRQLDSNSYRSDNCVQFMMESLWDLDSQLKKKGSKLHMYKGNPLDIVKKLINKHNIEAVGFNIDYTPFAKRRDNSIINYCEQKGIEVFSEHDSVLSPIDEIFTTSGSYYKVYTSFATQARKHIIHNQVKSIPKFLKVSNKEISIPFTENENIAVHGGRKAGKRLLVRAKKLTDYGKNRDFMAKDRTTHLSAYNKFGCVSIREVYAATKHIPTLVDELLWRDFYYNIMDKYDVIGKSLNPKYDKFPWHTKHFTAWCNGETGFPIVDAGMRQMNETGYMHNRCRMIVSSFLVKILGIDWRRGEKYFAQTLVDYDPAQNSGGWQWSAGGGGSSQPFFQVFNPFEQSKKYDPDCEYIKTWVEELEKVPAKDIHNWNKKAKDYEVYIVPIVDFAQEKAKIQKWMK